MANGYERGVAVGSRADFEEMNRYLDEKKVKLTPALDRVYKFSESKEAFDHLLSGKHTGKIVITF
jgi:D-arabinose 1-dehydrogenase-like Zn-dependent alcohol dehydrogenase